MAAYRESDLTLEVQMAFAVSDDHDRQDHAATNSQAAWRRPCCPPKDRAGCGLDRHIKELDGVRAVAVMGVLLSHWGYGGLLDVINPGGIGVRLFFVLSGLLITGILLDARNRLARAQEPLRVLPAFYARRTLRILPAYYLVLTLAAGFGVAVVADNLPWHAFHLSNVVMARHDAWFDSASHLWSLAVEEQFYLIWPLVVLKSPRRALVPMILLMIATGPLFRAAMMLGGASALQATVLLPATFDALGLGALLACAARADAPVRGVGRLAAAGAILLWVCWILPLQSLHREAFFTLAVGLLSCGALAAILRHPGHPALAPLRWAPVAYLGTISYGVYLYHGFVGAALAPYLPDLGWKLAFLIKAATTIGLAALSWRLLEQPLNALKHRFPYTAAPGPNAQVARP